MGADQYQDKPLPYLGILKFLNVQQSGLGQEFVSAPNGAHFLDHDPNFGSSRDTTIRPVSKADKTRYEISWSRLPLIFAR